VYWPELITHDKAFDGQDVFVFEYPSPKSGDSLLVDEVAEHLRLMLVTEEVLRYNSITFISHSMGGVVTRAYIIKYRSQVVSKIRLLYFYATPTTGSPYATLANLVSRNRQFGELRPMSSDSYLGSVQSSWLAGDFHLKSYCAYETLPFLGQRVVSRESATNLCTQRLDPIDANHVDIVKPADLQSTTHRALKAAFVETAPDARKKRRTSSSSSKTQLRERVSAKQQPKLGMSKSRTVDNPQKPFDGAPTADRTYSGSVVSFGQRGGITAAQVNIVAEPAVNPVVPEMSITTNNGLNPSDFQNGNITADMMRHYRRHSLTVKNTNVVDISNITVRLQLPEPVVVDHIIEERPPGIEISWDACRMSWTLSGDGASSEATPSGGIQVTTASVVGAGAVLSGGREVCSASMTGAARHSVDVYKLGVSRLPAGSSIRLAFHTLDVAGEVGDQKLSSLNVSDPDILLFYGDGTFQFQNRGQTITRRVFMPLHFSEQQRRITSLPSSGEVGRWKLLTKLSGP